MSMYSRMFTHLILFSTLSMIIENLRSSSLQNCFSSPMAVYTRKPPLQCLQGGGGYEWNFLARSAKTFCIPLGKKILPPNVILFRHFSIFCNGKLVFFWLQFKSLSQRNKKPTKDELDEMIKINHLYNYILINYTKTKPILYFF